MSTAPLTFSELDLLDPFIFVEEDPPAEEDQSAEEDPSAEEDSVPVWMKLNGTAAVRLRFPFPTTRQDWRLQVVPKAWWNRPVIRLHCMQSRDVVVGSLVAAGLVDEFVPKKNKK